MNQGNGDKKDEREILRSTFGELQTTISRKLDAQSELNEKAIEIIKINLLAGSLVAASIQFIPINQIPFVFLIGGSIALIYSIWACLMTISLRPYTLGLGKGSVEDLDGFLDKSVEDHYRELVKTYRSTLTEIGEPMDEEANHFKRGMWSSLAAILFFLAGGFRLVLLPDLPPSYDAIFLLIIPLFVLWGKCKAEGDCDVKYERR